MHILVGPHNYQQHYFFLQDTIAVTKNMKYDFQHHDQVEVEDLEDFKLRLVKQMLLNTFFQDEKKQDFDMLR